jgi:hypothetical protein
VAYLLDRGEHGRIVTFSVLTEYVTVGARKECTTREAEGRRDSTQTVSAGQAGKADEQAPELDAWSSFL